MIRRLMFLVVSTVLLTTTTLAQEAQPAKLPGQYKRVHQDAYKKILAGRSKDVTAALGEFLKKHPKDEESHYMLAVAYAQDGDLAASQRHAKKAIELGLPPGRIVGGTLTGLAPLLETDYGKKLLAEHKHTLVHGPMVGNVTPKGFSVWVRTAGEADVRLVYYGKGFSSKDIDRDRPASVQVEAPKVVLRPAEEGDGEPKATVAALVYGASKAIRTSKENDYTAVLTVDGFPPDKVHRFNIEVNGKIEDQPEDGYKVRTAPAQGKPTKFRLAFGGGAGYVPPNERVWDTIGEEKPDMLVLLGDNVYIDDPQTPAMQHYTYYRRQSRPEFRKLIATTPVYSIWDDHDFGTNDCSGGPEIDKPQWKRPVWNVYKNNWVNPRYGGGEKQPGCWYDFYRGDVHFIMLDGRYYRNLKPDDNGRSSMLGPVQRKWLLDALKDSKGEIIVLCSPVPWVFEAKGDSRDTWSGFRDERNEIFDFLAEHKIEGVVLMSADRHRSDLWKIERDNGYPLFEFNSSRLTNQHVHPTMKAAEFSYNKKQSFGTVDIDTTLDDPTVTYRIVTIDGEEVNKFTVKRSELCH